MKRIRKRLRLCAAAAVLLGLSGCAAQMLHRTGMELVGDGQFEAGLAALGKAVDAAPQDVAIRKDFYTARLTAESRLLAAANAQLAQGNLAGAETELRKLLAIDAGNVQARQAMARVERAGAQMQSMASAREAQRGGDTERALGIVNLILAQDPEQRAALAMKRALEAPLLMDHFKEVSLKDSRSKPINLDFRDANVRQVLEALSRISGIGFLIDKDIAPDLRVTVVLQNAEIDEVLNLILRNSALRSKVLNKKTVQIYPDTAEKRKEYQELVVRAFYLQDATTTQIQTVLKSLLRMKDVVVDERLNLVTVRDTPEAVRLAERLVALHDLPEPEVMLELEVLEVTRDDLLKLGIQWPNQFGVIPTTSGGGGIIPLDELRKLSSSRLGVSFTNPAISLRQDFGTTKLLANPRIRVHNREKASILIGDKVPVITTTSTATGFVAENIQYLDVGLKLAAEPVIHPSNDVSLRLSLEVSSIASQVSTPNGSVAYQVGTRNAATFLRLQDGETQVLAGLISDQDRRSASGVPGLSKLPLLGRLFSAPSDSRNKTEIVLSVTPRVVRSAARPEAQAVQFWSGTENGLSTAPVRLSGDDGPAEPATSNAGAALPASSASSATSATFVAAAPAPPQLVWNGPNQVKAGETFTLTLRLKAAKGAAPGPLRIGYDSAALTLKQMEPGRAGEGPDGARLGGIALDASGRQVELDIGRILGGGAEIDANVLTLTMTAGSVAGVTALNISGPAGQATPAYPVTIVP